MESPVFAAQEQAVSTNAIKAHIYRSQSCRLCGLADETIDHLVSCCPVLAQREYKPRHDHVASHVDWLLANKLAFLCQMFGGNALCHKFVKTILVSCSRISPL